MEPLRKKPRLSVDTAKKAPRKRKSALDKDSKKGSVPKKTPQEALISDANITSRISGKLSSLKKKLREQKSKLKQAGKKGRAGKLVARAAEKEIERLENEIDELTSGVEFFNLKSRVHHAAAIIAENKAMRVDEHAHSVLSRTSSRLPEVQTLRKSCNPLSRKDNNRAKRRRPQTAREVRALHTDTDMMGRIEEDAFGVEFHNKPVPVYVIRQQVCSECGGRLCDDERSVEAVCSDCGAVVHLLADARTTSENYSSGDDAQLRSCYKRRNHFSDWVKKLQGKEKVSVPEDVLDRVCDYIRKKGIKTSDDMRVEHVLAALKFHTLPTYYEHKQLM